MRTYQCLNHWKVKIFSTGSTVVPESWDPLPETLEIGSFLVTEDVYEGKCSPSHDISVSELHFLWSGPWFRGRSTALLVAPTEMCNHGNFVGYGGQS